MRGLPTADGRVERRLGCIKFFLRRELKAPGVQRLLPRKVLLQPFFTFLFSLFTLNSPPFFSDSIIRRRAELSIELTLRTAMPVAADICTRSIPASENMSHNLRSAGGRAATARSKA